MGLYAMFDIEQTKYPLEVSQMDNDGFEWVVEVDYTAALDALTDTFDKVSRQLVPVDTGYLRSTISCENDGYTIAEFFADAEYAEYVEYGTWKMDEQPYFRPALEQGLEEFKKLADEVLEEARNEVNELVQEANEESQQEKGQQEGSGFGIGGGGTGSFMMDMAFTAALFVVLFPVLVNLYGIYDTLTSPFGDDNNSSFGIIEQLMPEIIIT